MNSLPTIYETVTGKKQAQEKTNGNSSSKKGSTTKSKKPPSSDEEDEDSPYDEDEDEHGDTFCGTCNGPYQVDKKEFWIGCDSCQKWFHGACVKITPAKAEHIKQYKCPTCSNRPRQVPGCRSKMISIRKAVSPLVQSSVIVISEKKQ